MILIQVGEAIISRPETEFQKAVSYRHINTANVYWLTGEINCYIKQQSYERPWWRHQMETFSASLAICAGNSPVPSEFPTQRPVTRSFDVFFDLRPNKRLSKQSWGWWFETPSHSLWRHRNAKKTTHRLWWVASMANITNYASGNVNITYCFPRIKGTWYEHHGVSNHRQLECFVQQFARSVNK